jgi:hypothetical protein
MGCIHLLVLIYKSNRQFEKSYLFKHGNIEN